MLLNEVYGTIFDYLGCMANAGYTSGCVPQFIFDTLHNPNGKNPRKIIAKLIMKNVIGDLGMQTEGEGCCISQIADLCQKRKVIYDAMGFKHKLFVTNKDTTPAHNLPRLIFICANNHLYHITDAEQRETIFKSCLKAGNAVNIYIYIYTHIKYNISTNTRLIMGLTQIYVHCEDMSIYGLLEHVKQNKENKHMWHTMLNRTKIRTIKHMGSYRIVTSQRGLCNSLLYDQITRLGNTHNGYVQINKHNQIWVSNGKMI